MRITRRQALGGLARFLCASPLLKEGNLFAQSQQALTGAEEPLLELVNVFDFAKLAKSKLDPLAWDYLDGGGKDEISLRDNREAFNRIIIRPRMLTDVHNIDVTANLLGKKLDCPIFICPAGGKNCFYKNGEEEVARGAVESGSMMITNGGIDDFLTSGKGPPHWYQMTTGGQFMNRNTMLNFVEKLEDMGASGICFTVDNMYVSHRERSIRNRFVRRWCNLEGIPRDAQGNLNYKEGDQAWTTGTYPSRPFPTPTWETMRQLRELTDLPIIIKGILTAEDAEKCVTYGMSAAMVSNHGARQLDHVGSTIEALPECVQAVNGKIPVLIDGGFRRGTDILKALALGATAVGVARPYLWGLACFGQRGVSRVLELLKVELALDMGLAGAAAISEVDPKLIRIRQQ